MIRLELPWPSRKLHPNARVHWSQKAAATKKARSEAKILCQSAIRADGFDVITWEGAKILVQFFPPDNRRRDMDGMISSHKAAQDGIADALGIDDNLFEVTYRKATTCHPGAVVVILEPSNPKRKGNEI